MIHNSLYDIEWVIAIIWKFSNRKTVDLPLWGVPCSPIDEIWWILVAVASVKRNMRGTRGEKYGGPERVLRLSPLWRSAPARGSVASPALSTNTTNRKPISFNFLLPNNFFFFFFWKKKRRYRLNFLQFWHWLDTLVRI